MIFESNDRFYPKNLEEISNNTDYQMQFNDSGKFFYTRKLYFNTKKPNSKKKTIKTGRYR